MKEVWKMFLVMTVCREKEELLRGPRSGLSGEQALWVGGLSLLAEGLELQLGDLEPQAEGLEDFGRDSEKGTVVCLGEWWLCE